MLMRQPFPNVKVKRLYIDGCFDLMHSGHFNAIRQAKNLCETLVVGVVSDEEIQENKGPNIFTLQERVTLVKMCKWADEVVEGVPYDPDIPLLDKLNCSHAAHGDDIIILKSGQYAYKDIIEANRMLIYKRTSGISTTEIVGRLLALTQDHHQESKRKHSTFQRKVSISKQQNSLLTAKDLVQNELEISKDEQENHEIHNRIRKLSTEHQPNKKDLQQKNTVYFLNTTQRIRQFSLGNREPTPEDKVVYIDGAFDILHLGHAHIIQKAKELGTYLIVGLHDDEAVKIIKGDNFPVLNMQERILCVLACKQVDEVVLGAPWIITESMIKNLNISLVLQGSIGKGQKQIEEEFDPYEVPKKMGIYQTIESIDFTVLDIIQRIIDNRLKILHNQAIKEQKLLNYYQSQQEQKKNPQQN